MTPLLLVVFVALAVFVDVFVHQRRRRLALAATRAVQFVRSSRHPPPDAYLHPGHTWVRVHDENLVSVGVTGFAANFAGELSEIDLPREGRRLGQAERACTLVSKGNRRLDLAMPIAGRVLAVNSQLQEDPGLVQQHPYEEGWLLRLRPRKLGAALASLLPAQAAQAWLDASRTLVAGKLEPSVGRLLNDGGELDVAFGERLPDETWAQVRSELFPNIEQQGK